MQGPFIRLLIYFGQKGGCGFLSSRCGVPQGLTAKSRGCTEVVLDWAPAASINPFHEESYRVAWRRQEGQTDWVELNVEGNESGNNSGKKMRFFISNVPEQERILVKVSASNSWGRGPWSEEVKTETLARPSSDGGFIGPLGPAGQGYHKGTYTWTQTSTEVGLRAPIPADWKAKDISFKAMPHRIQILHAAGKGAAAALEGKEFLAGNFPKRIKADEVLWEIEENEADGRHLAVQLQKAEKMDKWRCFVEGNQHPCIDVRLVQLYTKEMAGIDIWED